MRADTPCSILISILGGGLGCALKFAGEQLIGSPGGEVACQKHHEVQQTLVLGTEGLEAAWWKRIQSPAGQQVEHRRAVCPCSGED